MQMFKRAAELVVQAGQPVNGENLKAAFETFHLVDTGGLSDGISFTPTETIAHKLAAWTLFGFELAQLGLYCVRSSPIPQRPWGVDRSTPSEVAVHACRRNPDSQTNISHWRSACHRRKRTGT